MYYVLTLYTVFKLVFLVLYLYDIIVYKYITAFIGVLYFIVFLGLNINISMAIITILWIVFYKLSIINVKSRSFVFNYIIFSVIFFNQFSVLINYVYDIFTFCWRIVIISLRF
uniref:hypothetical protein n=1 Tax=Periconia digitata TaxID=1303443 RepID=UPI0023AA48C9|nr:hypothetical protein P1Q94_mgp17 [Periconia digitata]WCA44863.1 hypothetical protein [Periconia digitata]